MRNVFAPEVKTMGYFDHVMMSGLPPIGLDLDLGGALSTLALLMASLLAILCVAKSDLSRRMISRWRSGSPGMPRIEQPSGQTPAPITLGRAIRLTSGPRK
jgi:hypothetical protein